jgi:hypothetical protein
VSSLLARVSDPAAASPGVVNKPTPCLLACLLAAAAAAVVVVVVVVVVVESAGLF